MTDPLTHRCRAERTCVARTPDGSAVTLKPSTLCRGCVDDIQRALDALPALKVGLRAFVAVPIAGGGYSESVSSSKEPPSPMNARVVDLIDEIDRLLDDVGSLPVRDLINQPGDAEVVNFVGKTVRIINDGVHRALRLRAAHTKADNIVGLSATWERRGAPCPHCHDFTLGGWAGRDQISCTNCGSGMTRSEYEDSCIIKVRHG